MFCRFKSRFKKAITQRLTLKLMLGYAATPRFHAIYNVAHYQLYFTAPTLFNVCIYTFTNSIYTFYTFYRFTFTPATNYIHLLSITYILLISIYYTISSPFTPFTHFHLHMLPTTYTYYQLHLLISIYYTISSPFTHTNSFIKINNTLTNSIFTIHSFTLYQLPTTYTYYQLRTFYLSPFEMHQFKLDASLIF
jgi:hypothetical protein